MRKLRNKIENYLKDYKNSILILMYSSGTNKKNKDRNYWKIWKNINLMKKEGIKPIWRCLAKTTQAELQKDLDLIVKGFKVKDQRDKTDLCRKQVQKRI